MSWPMSRGFRKHPSNPRKFLAYSSSRSTLKDSPIFTEKKISIHLVNPLPLSILPPYQQYLPFDETK